MATTDLPPVRGAFHVVRGSRAFLLVPTDGLPLGVRLDDLLAFLVRSYPLHQPFGSPLVPPDRVEKPRDALDERHLALYRRLVERGYRVPDAIIACAARIHAVQSPVQGPGFLLPAVRAAWETRIRLWESELLQLRELLAAWTPPASRQVFADPAERSALNLELLQFLALAVDASSAGDALSLVPKVRWPADLAAEAEAWQEAHPSAPSLMLNPAPSVWA